METIINKNKLNKKKNLVLTIYRPPNTDFFINQLGNFFTKYSNKNYDITITGDFNIDLLKSQNNKLSFEFKNFMYSNSFKPLIKIPTYITKKSASLIDNIFINNDHDSVYNGVISIDFSDHLPTFYIKKLEINSTLEKDNIKLRTLSFANIRKINNALYLTDWSKVLGSKDVNVAYSTFLKTYLGVVNTFCPIINTCRLNHKRKCWITQGLINSSITKNNLYKKYIKNRTDKNKFTYLSYKKIYERVKKMRTKLL